MNPILGKINQNSIMTQLAPLKNMFNMVKAAQNPQAALTQMMQNNPNFAQAQKVISENGGDAKKAFYDMAKQKGVNPEDVLNIFR